MENDLALETRASTGSSRLESESSPSSLPAKLQTFTTSDSTTSASSTEPDALVDSATFSSRSSDSIRPPTKTGEAEEQQKEPPTKIIVLDPQGPLKTPLTKRIIIGTSNSANLNHQPDPTESGHNARSSTNRSNAPSTPYRLHFYSRSSQSPDKDDSEYLIPTDKPADFPFIAHSYRLKNPGSVEEPTGTAIYARTSNDITVPVGTTVKQGEEEWTLTASADPERQAVRGGHLADAKLRQVRMMMERSHVWEKVRPTVGE